MWLLTCTKGTDYYLLAGKEHLVSRRDGDLVLADDQSVSRKHAIISVQHDVSSLGDPGKLPVVILTDCSSKYGIFINDGIEKSVKMANGSNQVLQNGDRIRFGLQWNVWRLEHRPLVITTSTLTPAEKKKLKEHIVKLGGHLISNWQDSVTHVTMSSITLTVKVVCALAQGKHIVTPQYWEQYVTAILSKEPVPDCKNFIPPLAETTLNVNEVSFDVNENRKTLFAGKKFVFFSDHQYKNYSCMVNAAGGEACKMNESEVNLQTLIEPDVIVMQYSFPRQSQDSQLPDSFQEVTKFLKSKGRRAVPESEIGLAILYCSLEKNCNPELSVVSTLLTSESRGICSQSHAVLALDTPFSENEPPKETIVIPDSGSVPKKKTDIPDSGTVPQNDAVPRGKNMIFINDETSDFSIGRIKRERLSVTSDEVDAATNPHKRMKVLEEDGFLAKKAIKSTSRLSTSKSSLKTEVKEEIEDEEDPFKFPSDVPVRSKEDSDVEDMFAFSQEPEITQFESSKESSPLHAQSSKKRKEVNTEMEPVNKKRAVEKEYFDPVDNHEQQKIFLHEFISANPEKKENTSLDDTMASLSNGIKNVTVVEIKQLITQKLYSEPSRQNLPKCNNFKKFTKVRSMHTQQVISSKDMVAVNIDKKGLNEWLNDSHNNTVNVENDDDDDDDDWAFAPVSQSSKNKSRSRCR